MSDVFEKWLTIVCERSLPAESFARMESFVREIADGAMKGYWSYRTFHRDTRTVMLRDSGSTSGIHPRNLHVTRASAIIQLRQNPLLEFDGDNYFIAHYLHRRWEFEWPDIDLMVINGYLSAEYELTKSAFDLARSFRSASVFISYRRVESSAFALLVLARLKLVGLEGFLDLAIQPGENWHAGIRERIQQYDSFVLLLGPTTLKSDIVKQEIQWAIEFGLDILPIWHSGFAYNADDWPELPPDVTRVLGSNHSILGSNHSIRVLDESALGYNNAIVELLNRYGVTP